MTGGRRRRGEKEEEENNLYGELSAGSQNGRLSWGIFLKLAGPWRPNPVWDLGYEDLHRTLKYVLHFFLSLFL